MKRSFKIITFLVIFAFITSGFMNQIKLNGISSPISPGSQLDSTYTPQVQFTIDSNSDFDIVDSGGDGSSGNPWIIEGWMWYIWSVGYAIYITDTTDHFIIRNCYIYGFFAGISIGIVLDNVQNGRIENVIFSASSVYLPEPPNPSPPYGYPSLAGLEMIDCNSNEVVNNYFLYEGDGNFMHGIKMTNCDNNNITGNTINAYYDLHMTNCESNNILLNHLVGKTYMVDTDYIKGETQYGIWAWGCHWNHIEGNNIKRGFRMEYCVENTILDNYIPAALIQEISCTNNAFIKLYGPELGANYVGPSGPAAGYYPASEPFETYADGYEPYPYTGTGTGRFAKIVANKTDASGYDHQKVLHCFTGSGSYPQINLYDGYENLQSGTYEFWMLKEDPGIGTIKFELLGSSDQTLSSIQVNDTFWYQDNSTLESTGIPAENNKWYRLSIDFATDNTYAGLDYYQYRFRIHDSDGKNILYKSPNLNFENIGVVYKLNSFVEGDAANNLSVYLDAIGFTWDLYYTIGDNQEEGMWLSYRMQLYGMSWSWFGYELDGQLMLISKGYEANSIIPRPTLDGVHQIQLIGSSYSGNKTSWTHSFTTSYYQTYWLKQAHWENTKPVPPGKVILTPTEDLNVTLKYKTMLGPIDTWSKVSIHYTVNERPWNVSHLGYNYSTQTVNFVIDEGNYSDFDRVFYYFSFQLYDNNSQYLDSYFFTQDGVEQYDFYEARENAFQKKIGPIPFELTLNYSVFYHHQLDAIIPNDAGGNTTLHPLMHIAYENFTLDFYNLTSAMSEYSVSCTNESQLDHILSAETSNISIATGPQFTYSQGVKSPFILPLTLPLTEHISNITVPKVCFDSIFPSRNLTFTSTLFNLTYRGYELDWPNTWRVVEKFSFETPLIKYIIRYDIFTRIMVHLEFINLSVPNRAQKIVFTLTDNNASYPANLEIDQRDEVAYEGNLIIPNHLLAILYDPPGDHSYSEMKSGTSITFGLSLRGEYGKETFNDWKCLGMGFGGGEEDHTINTVSSEFDIESTVTFEITMTSSMETDNASLMGPGRGDLYYGSGLLVQYFIMQHNYYIVRNAPDAPNANTDDIRLWNTSPWVKYGLTLNATFSILGAYLGEYGLSNLAQENIFADNIINEEEAQHVLKLPQSPVFWTPEHYTEFLSSTTNKTSISYEFSIQQTTSSFFCWNEMVTETVGYDAFGVSFGTSYPIEESNGMIGTRTTLTFTTTMTSATESNRQIVCHLEDDDGTPIGEHDQFAIDIYYDLRYKTFGYIIQQPFTFTSRPYEFGTRDHRSPTLSHIYDLDEYVQGTITVNCGAVDEETGVSYVKFYYDTVPFFDFDFSQNIGYQDNVSATPNVYQFTWDTSTFHGTYYLFAVTYDQASPLKNYRISGTYTIYIDNVKPTTCQARSYGPYLGAIPLYANVYDADSGIECVQYWDGDPSNPNSTLLGTSYDSSNSYLYTWATDPAGSDDGLHYIYARAFDQAGNYLDSSLFELTVESEAPINLQDLLTLIMLGAIVGLASVLTVMVWKTRKPTPLPPKPKGELTTKSPLDILKTRLAQGEITQDEYLQSKKLLEESETTMNPTPPTKKVPPSSKKLLKK
ncbi:MAG TPA: SHOCT domain-containing protein [Candidatus Deferrimicrobium sp.]|nr:SHOCT domain-containing protein [Candidatus Deferrimicrobium sp.]